MLPPGDSDSEESLDTSGSESDDSVEPTTPTPRASTGATPKAANNTPSTPARRQAARRKTEDVDVVRFIVILMCAVSA